MTRTARDLVEIIDDIEKAGHKLVLFISIATSEQPLSERASKGFLEYGIETLQNFSDIEIRLKHYREACALS